MQFSYESLTEYSVPRILHDLKFAVPEPERYIPLRKFQSPWFLHVQSHRVEFVASNVPATFTGEFVLRIVSFRTSFPLSSTVIN
jgi:hypothetical protein